MTDADTEAGRGEGRDLVLYDTPEQGYALVLEYGISGFRIGGPKLYGQQKEVARFPLDERARRKLTERLRQSDPGGGKDDPVECPRCGWSGDEGDTVWRTIMHGREEACPECDARVLIRRTADPDAPTDEAPEGEPTYEQLVAAMDLCADDEAFFVRKRETGEIIPVLLLNDVFAWGAADGEEVPWSVVVELRDRIRTEGWPAGVRWAAERRGQEPQEPMKEAMARTTTPDPPTVVKTERRTLRCDNCGEKLDADGCGCAPPVEEVEMSQTILHVNVNKIRSNLKTEREGRDDPDYPRRVCRAEDDETGKVKYADGFELTCRGCGNVVAELVSKWLGAERRSCGATVYIVAPNDRVWVRALGRTE